jgi:hypothetical protein
MRGSLTPNWLKETCSGRNTLLGRILPDTREAREAYYTENSFIVLSHWLCEFLVDTLANGEPFHVDSLVRNIRVTVDLVSGIMAREPLGPA